MNIFTTAARIWLTRSFRPFKFTNDYDEQLDYGDSDQLGLYVHIPFCRSICEFCPYCKTIFHEETAGTYIKALLKEIDFVGKISKGKKKRVTSLYFGGGSPALVVDDIQKIIARLQKYFEITEGIGIELHPQDVCEETLLKLKEAGISKISIGVQSFQKEYLHILGRQFVDFQSMFNSISEVRFETVSVDFIFALPNQTIDLLIEDIEFAFHHGANHIAVYPFIDFTFTSRNFSKMGEAGKKKLLYQLVHYCETKGYVRDSIWTFSKNGESKYSSMTRENFLGFGCSATTLLKDQFKINTFSVEQYIARIEKGKLPTALTLRFRLRQRMIYYLFWTAYTMRINEKSFHDFFGYSLKVCYGLELFFGRFLGLVRMQEGNYVMTTKGSYYYHYFEHIYTLSYIDQMWTVMGKNPFPEKLIIR